MSDYQLCYAIDGRPKQCLSRRQAGEIVNACKHHRNMANYDHEAVRRLNDAATDAWIIADKAIKKEQ